MNRFFGKTENIFEDHIIIKGSDVNHIKNVLRMKCQDQIMVSGGDNCDYLCSIQSMEDTEISLEIIEKLISDKELPTKVYLFQGLPKSDKFELIIQKCVELGVYEIIPVAMKRCVVKLDDKKARSKITRWQAISESAAKQSGRTVIPRIQNVMSFQQALEYAKTMDMGIIPYELAEGMKDTKLAMEQIHEDMQVAVFIGPEGGFDLKEIESAIDKKIMPVSLGKRILRTETAGMTVMSIIMYHLEV